MKVVPANRRLALGLRARHAQPGVKAPEDGGGVGEQLLVANQGPQLLRPSLVSLLRRTRAGQPQDRLPPNQLETAGGWITWRARPGALEPASGLLGADHRVAAIASI